MSASKERWENLLEWLEDHGMKREEVLVDCRSRPGAGNGLFAARPCPPSTVLFTIPASALANIRTLSPHYPCWKAKPLNATQLISLHLFLHRPTTEGVCSDPLFGPYISVLPTDFPGHPLTWLILGMGPVQQQFLRFLPPGARAALDKVSNRFKEDWRIVQEYLVWSFHSPGIISNLTTSQREYPDVLINLATEDFLWAWLNVNTRCVYHRLKRTRSDPDNLTMCPILDFANHRPFAPLMMPTPSDAEIWNSSPTAKVGDALGLVSPHTCAVEPNEELYLRYGAHSNQTLFVEYSFVNEMLKNAAFGGRYDGEVDVQDVMEELFKERGLVGGWMKNILTEEGYWGEWTLHSSPQPAHPSFRLITALRLYHVIPSLYTGVPSEPATYVDPWRETILGYSEVVSQENEKQWRDTLRQICNTVSERATRSLVGFTHQQNTEVDDLGWVQYAADCITTLWREELEVSGAVLQSLDGEVEF
ncbi:hypothetical protein JAAARDRAFT_124205 [Jaapia argillacea MUCL 33604]|uniref:SET domain-containing protein n=1 Tax=Jaapia argillacea MUCL 33604 TaxID=933084 RepID=A0A067Q187_9AGAM|nr:hypothetical protein JAAARDRAFT_124205 [Jaapia argillacea MUCL 33604]